MFFHFLITTINHTQHVIILAENGICPFLRHLFIETILVQQVPYPHHIVVMTARRIDGTVSLHLRTDLLLVTVGDAPQLTLPFALLLPPADEALGSRPYLLLGERLRPGLVIHVRVVAETAQPSHVLAFLVVCHAIGAAVVLVAIEERLGVVLLLLLQVIAVVQLIAEHDTDAVTADGAVAQQRVRVATESAEECLQRL